MRLLCYHCGKSVSSELPEDSVVRAVLFCPECIERIVQKKLKFTDSFVANLMRDPEPETRP